MMEMARQVVTISGGGVSIAPELAAPPKPLGAAFLNAFLPGPRGGEALADVILGRVSPSGRLPYTMWAPALLLPAIRLHAPAVWTSRWLDSPLCRAVPSHLLYIHILYNIIIIYLLYTPSVRVPLVTPA
jgi:hypothetical protein